MTVSFFYLALSIVPFFGSFSSKNSFWWYRFYSGVFLICLAPKSPRLIPPSAALPPSVPAAAGPQESKRAWSSSHEAAARKRERGGWRPGSMEEEERSSATGSTEPAAASVAALWAPTASPRGRECRPASERAEPAWEGPSLARASSSSPASSKSSAASPRRVRQEVRGSSPPQRAGAKLPFAVAAAAKQRAAPQRMREKQQKALSTAKGREERRRREGSPKGKVPLVSSPSSQRMETGPQPSSSARRGQAKERKRQPAAARATVRGLRFSPRRARGRAGQRETRRGGAPALPETAPELQLWGRSPERQRETKRERVSWRGTGPARLPLRRRSPRSRARACRASRSQRPEGGGEGRASERR